MDIQFQLQLAKEAGREEDYKYHLGMVEHPLPFFRWQMLCQSLDKHLKADPDGRDEFRDKRINDLCRILGY
jgi:hypothetical protein